MTCDCRFGGLPCRGGCKDQPSAAANSAVTASAGAADFIARLGNGRLHLIRQRLAGAYGLTGVAGLRLRLMCRVMRVFRMLLMRGGRCLMCRGVTRTGDRARKKEACEIENREL